MEIKKSPKADLEGKRSTWLLVGYVVVLAVLFVSFEWSQRDVEVATDTGIVEQAFEEEIIPITQQVEEVKAPPPPEAPSVAEILTIVDDDADIQETVIASTEFSESEAIEVKHVEVDLEEEEPEEETIFQVVEVMPEFPGGMAACLKYLSQNIKYPVMAQENGIQGRVIVQFVVNSDGSIVDPVVVRSVDPSLDREALRVIQSMPKWKPGQQRGKAVRVRYTVPVTFKLQ